MRVARAMVSGVDVWLNTPRRPLEASGTSGMKAAANGALNLSVLDGWWAEAWARHGSDVGWAIGHGEEYVEGDGDDVEAELLYDLLEREVVPLFFRRDGQSKLPRAWIKRMKSAISKLAPMFNTQRMVRQYVANFYEPSIRLTDQMMKGDLEGARVLAAWKERVREAWPLVQIKDVVLRSSEELKVGENARVEAVVQLGTLTPADVAMELYHGPTAGGHELLRGNIVRMKLNGKAGDGSYRFVGEIPTTDSGAHAFAARLMPWNDGMTHPYETSLIRWA
jgi:starch phosphorylase